MDNDMKVRSEEDIIVINSKMKETAIRIVKFEDLVGNDVPNAPIYVIKTSEDGINYLAELHLVHNEYGLTDSLCFKYNELCKDDQIKYEDASTTIMAKYADIRKYRPKTKKKKK